MQKHNSNTYSQVHSQAYAQASFNREPNKVAVQVTYDGNITSININAISNCITHLTDCAVIVFSRKTGEVLVTKLSPSTNSNKRESLAKEVSKTISSYQARIEKAKRAKTKVTEEAVPSLEDMADTGDTYDETMTAMLESVTHKLRKQNHSTSKKVK